MPFLCDFTCSDSYKLYIICSYDADSKKLKHLTPLGETLVHYSGEELDFLGPYPFILFHVRQRGGNIDLFTYECVNSGKVLFSKQSNGHNI